MGLNVNLCHMLGVTKTTVCPKCKAVIETQFADYDIECGNPNPKPGQWALHVYCDKCEHEFNFKFTVRPALI